ncbi:MAG: hypothetical protein Q8M08_12245 [Bacteroidales bacterium]|nr:hypothetical protein [Bacteroidales bacterium]
MKRFVPILSIFIFCLLWGCAEKIVALKSRTAAKDKYTSDFPAKNAAWGVISTNETVSGTAIDISNDIAILGKKCEMLTDTVIPLQYHSGYASDLGWGSIVYIFGFPLGNQVMTRGLASPAPKRPMGDFSIDALLNHGFSGGIILATRSGIPDFELLGMVKTVHSTREEYLKPATDQQRTPDWMAYRGDAVVGKSDHIQYGLNAVVPVEAIRDFYRKNRDELILNGYDLDYFFYPGNKAK